MELARVIKLFFIYVDFVVLLASHLCHISIKLLCTVKCCKLNAISQKYIFCTSKSRKHI